MNDQTPERTGSAEAKIPRVNRLIEAAIGQPQLVADAWRKCMKLGERREMRVRVLACIKSRQGRIVIDAAPAIVDVAAAQLVAIGNLKI